MGEKNKLLETRERGPIEHYQVARAAWFPEGKQIAFVGTEPGHGARAYV